MVGCGAVVVVQKVLVMRIHAVLYRGGVRRFLDYWVELLSCLGFFCCLVQDGREWYMLNMVNM